MDAEGQHAMQVTPKGLSKGYDFVDFSLINGRKRKIDGRTGNIYMYGHTWEIDGRASEIDGC